MLGTSDHERVPRPTTPTRLIRHFQNLPQDRVFRKGQGDDGHHERRSTVPKAAPFPEAWTIGMSPAAFEYIGMPIEEMHRPPGLLAHKGCQKKSSATSP